jgi:hypothetical protein
MNRVVAVQAEDCGRDLGRPRAAEAATKVTMKVILGGDICMATDIMNQASCVAMFYISVIYVFRIIWYLNQQVSESFYVFFV